MFIRKKVFRFGDCSTPIKVPRFCRLTGFTKMELMKYKECFISWCWSHTLSIIVGGFTALQTLGLFKKQKTKFIPIT